MVPSLNRRCLKLIVHNSAECYPQRIVQELRNMDGHLRNTIKQQQKAVEATFIEWERGKSPTHESNTKLVEGKVAN
ncbi:hypothetical protein B0J13DRAFT_578045 [Dactylonectria estremocensis]|uniref:Uncharacterized protein n=1 Tax=Dactylonectria estremocensis TaxID=1079267 RepID=A0A9P9D0V1_9HYPO|nr:hypothetical protein B0J13DRAFT_578045 [Dactylonectria estremocensis]